MFLSISILSILFAILIPKTFQFSANIKVNSSKTTMTSETFAHIRFLSYNSGQNLCPIDDIKPNIKEERNCLSGTG